MSTCRPLLELIDRRHRRLGTRVAFGVLLLGASADALAAQRVWHPSITSASPNVVTVGGTVTLTGVDLDPPGWRPRILYVAKYGGQKVPMELLTRSGTTLTFAAPIMREEGLEVEWTIGDASMAQANPIPPAERRRPVSTPVVVKGPPSVTFAGTPRTADLGPAFPWVLVGASNMTLKGKSLRRTAMPTVTFAGSPLAVLQHTFEPAGSLASDEGAGTGADRLVVSSPAQPASGWLVVDNSLGRDSMFVTAAAPPMTTRVFVRLPQGNWPLTPPNTLQRGRTYALSGQRLSIVHAAPGGTSIRRGVALINGTMVTPSFATDTNLVFTVPLGTPLSTAALAVRTPAGEYQVGTYALVDPTVTLDVSGVSETSLSLVASMDTAIVATVTIPQDAQTTQWGALRAVVPPTAAGAISLSGSYPVLGPQVQIRMQAMSVQSATTFPLKIEHQSNGVNGVPTQTQLVQVTVRPPRPLSIDHVTGELIAGTATSMSVLFDPRHRGSSTMFTLLGSSNPNIINIPPTAVISNAKAGFVARIAQLDEPTAVTLSATMDGVTVSKSFSVRLPRLTELKTAVFGGGLITEAFPGDTVYVEPLFDGRLKSSALVGMTSSDTAIRVVPGGRWSSLPEGWFEQVVISPGLTEVRQVTLTATYAGSTKTSTLTARPIQISSFAATPSSGRAGGTINATTLLSRTPRIPMTVKYVSGDPSMASVPGAAQNVTGTSHVVPISINGTPATPRAVPITVTLYSQGLIIHSRTITVTVNP